MSHYDSYTIYQYGRMVRRSPRADGYVEALRRSITPGAVVVEIGTGTGAFAILAAQMGASKVYALETSPAIDLAREEIKAHGVADRVVLIRQNSQHIQLPEQADVLFSDLRGGLPLFGTHLPTIMDGRKRLLKPGGVQIPQSDTIYFAPVGEEAIYEGFRVPGAAYNLAMETTRKSVVNTWQRADIAPAHLLMPAQVWVTLDYRTLTETNYSNALTWTADHEGTLYGYGAWFDSVLLDEIGFSSAPGQPPVVYGQTFFPIDQPVEIAAGDTINANISAYLNKGDYLWTWETRVTGADGTAKASYKQSTFYSTPLSPDIVRRSSDKFVPSLNLEGQIDSLVLSLMDGTRSQGEIVQTLCEKFPQVFPAPRQALDHVTALAKRYSK